MSRGDGQHSFGHGQYCYWCGVDGDDPEIEKPCDERERQKPTEEQTAAYRVRNNLGDQVSAVALDFGLGIIEWDEMMTKIQALKPAGNESEGVK